MSNMISADLVQSHNAKRMTALQDEYASLGRVLERRGIAIDEVKNRVAALVLAQPTWGVGVGGTRFARFPIAGEPNGIAEKIEDCAVVQQLCRITPKISPHFPWDKVKDDPHAYRDQARSVGLAFDAVNSNTFQDQPGQAKSYRHGSLSHTDPATRAQAVEHNIDCIRLGEALGSKAITVWVGDGTNFPGQQSLGASLDRYLESAAKIYAALPGDWKMLLEHKLFEPAFYSTVISDWGSSLIAAQQLGEKAQCLIDLGHHAPNVNIEQIVARLHRVGKLGGFHFNDSKYGDDDLDSGSINPHQLFLIFNELVEAELRAPKTFDPAYMIDQSHNVTDPIESLLSSAEAIAGAYARALLVDRGALIQHQQENDVMMGFQTLRRAYNVDVAPILAMARSEHGGAVEPIAAYRESGWRAAKAKSRKATVAGAGIV